MTRWLLITGALLWLSALLWVIQDAVVNFPRSTVLWWGALTLLLGPLAVPLYLSERMARRAEMNKLGYGKAAFPVPEGRRPFRSAGMRQFEPVFPGSGISVVVQEGVDIGQSAEIPANGELVIRRSTVGEKSRPGVLVLHDNAVSREEHCRVLLKGDRLIVEDRSRWGTIVDGKRMQGGSVEVDAGSRIQIGKTVIAVRSGHDSDDQARV